MALIEQSAGLQPFCGESLSGTCGAPRREFHNSNTTAEPQKGEE